MKTEILFLAGMCLCACSRTPQEQTSFPSVKVVHAEVMEAPSSRCYTFISQPYRLSELSFGWEDLCMHLMCSRDSFSGKDN